MNSKVKNLLFWVVVGLFMIPVGALLVLVTRRRAATR